MRFGVPAASAVVFLVSLSAPAQSLNVPESDDAYHFADWLGTGHLGAYTEWWYFNVYDTANNVQAIFSYLITNPADMQGGLLRLGFSEMAAVAYTGSGIVTETDVYPAHAFSASYNAANVQIGANSVAVLDSDTYNITGASRDGRISWSLVYHRAAPSWFAANRFNVAPESWQLMSWLLYMPSAAVSGTLTIDGTAYTVNASGYHDHNWGEWNLTGVPWNWAQYAQPGLSFDLGDFPNKPGGIASIYAGGHRFIFNNNQYTLTHTQWAYDPKYGVNYPTQSVFQADNGAAQVSLVMNVNQTEGLSAPLPPGTPNAVVYEQTTAYTGQVMFGGSSVSFAGNGFKEYTALLN